MLEQKKRLLLYRLRKEMNGAALDTMRYFGEDYERNYGVQIYAIRNLAREIGTDHELAKSFYIENIREVRLVALWIADAEQVDVADFDFWASGIINSEVATCSCISAPTHSLMSSGETEMKVSMSLRRLNWTAVNGLPWQRRQE